MIAIKRAFVHYISQGGREQKRVLREKNIKKCRKASSCIFLAYAFSAINFKQTFSPGAAELFLLQRILHFSHSAADQVFGEIHLPAFRAAEDFMLESLLQICEIGFKFLQLYFAFTAYQGRLFFHSRPPPNLSLSCGNTR